MGNRTIPHLSGQEDDTKEAKPKGAPIAPWAPPSVVGRSTSLDVLQSHTSDSNSPGSTTTTIPASTQSQAHTGNSTNYHTSTVHGGGGLSFDPSGVHRGAAGATPVVRAPPGFNVSARFPAGRVNAPYPPPGLSDSNYHPQSSFSGNDPTPADSVLLRTMFNFCKFVPRLRPTDPLVFEAGFSAPVPSFNVQLRSRYPFVLLSPNDDKSQDPFPIPPHFFAIPKQSEEQTSAQHQQQHQHSHPQHHQSQTQRYGPQHQQLPPQHPQQYPPQFRPNAPQTNNTHSDSPQNRSWNNYSPQTQMYHSGYSGHPNDNFSLSTSNSSGSNDGNIMDFHSSDLQGRPQSREGSPYFSPGQPYQQRPPSAHQQRHENFTGMGYQQHYISNVSS